MCSLLAALHLAFSFLLYSFLEMTRAESFFHGGTFPSGKGGLALGLAFAGFFTLVILVKLNSGDGSNLTQLLRVRDDLLLSITESVGLLISSSNSARGLSFST